MPAQVVAQRGPLRDEPLAVIDQQPDVELRAGQPRDGQSVEAFAQRGARDRDGVDDVGFARLARRLARVDGELGCDPDDGLAAREQEPLQARPRHAGSPRSPTRASAPWPSAHAQQPSNERHAGPTPSAPRARARSPPRPQRRYASAYACPPRSRSSPCPSASVGVLEAGSPVDISQSRPKATHLSSHAGDPRTAASDKTSAGQTRPVDRKSMSQPAAS